MRSAKHSLDQRQRIITDFLNTEAHQTRPERNHGRWSEHVVSVRFDEALVVAKELFRDRGIRQCHSWVRAPGVVSVAGRMLNFQQHQLEPVGGARSPARQGDQRRLHGSDHGQRFAKIAANDRHQNTIRQKAGVRKVGVVLLKPAPREFLVSFSPFETRGEVDERARTKGQETCTKCLVNPLQHQEIADPVTQPSRNGDGARRTLPPVHRVAQQPYERENSAYCSSNLPVLHGVPHG